MYLVIGIRSLVISTGLPLISHLCYTARILSSSRMPTISMKNVFFAFFGIILLILLYQGIRIAKAPEIVQTAEADCIGEPIVVDYAFEWSVEEPHSCAVQCQDGRPRYILYTNGLGTQCEPPPGCNDYGEDNGILCTVPANVSPAAAASSES